MQVQSRISVLREVQFPEGFAALLKHALFPKPSKVLAIKAVRSFTGWGLKESKDFVDNVTEQQLDQPGPIKVRVTQWVTHEIPDSTAYLLRHILFSMPAASLADKEACIQALKTHGWSLKESKDFVDGLSPDSFTYTYT